MTKVAVRKATENDRDILEDLIGECYSRVYPGWYEADVLTDALPAMLRIDPALLGSGRYFAAIRDGETAGCGGWSTATPGSNAMEAATGHIRHFATHPKYMRTGVGGAIIQACIAEAKAEGVSRLKCFSSRPAEAFYQRHGFKRVDNVNIMMGDAVFPAVLMEMALA